MNIENGRTLLYFNHFFQIDKICSMITYFAEFKLNDISQNLI